MKINSKARLLARVYLPYRCLIALYTQTYRENISYRALPVQHMFRGMFLCISPDLRRVPAHQKWNISTSLHTGTGSLAVLSVHDFLFLTSFKKSFTSWPARLDRAPVIVTFDRPLSPSFPSGVLLRLGFRV